MAPLTPLRVNRKPTHPGWILREHYLVPRKITQSAFADHIDVSQKHLSRLINGHVRLEAELAAKLAKVLGTTTQIWINLQANVDAWEGDQMVADWTPKQYHLAAEIV